MASDFLKPCRAFRGYADGSKFRRTGSDLPAKHPSAFRKSIWIRRGRQMDSPAVCRDFPGSRNGRADLGVSDGRADGLPAPGGGRKRTCCFRSPRMTFPHELARAMLAEQIYQRIRDFAGPSIPALMWRLVGIPRANVLVQTRRTKIRRIKRKVNARTKPSRPKDSGRSAMGAARSSGKKTSKPRWMFARAAGRISGMDARARLQLLFDGGEYEEHGRRTSLSRSAGFVGSASRMRNG